MVQIISSRLAFSGKNSAEKSQNKSQSSQQAQSSESILEGFSREDILSLQDTVDQFHRAMRLPDETPAPRASHGHGAAFTEDVYEKVNQAMQQVRNHKLKGSVNRAGALKDLLNNDELLTRKFEIGKFTLHTSSKKPSLVMLMPKPVQRQQFADLTAGLSLRWLDTDLPAGCWLIDANNLKRIYCTSDASDLASLRQRHAVNTALGHQDLKDAMKEIFVLNPQ